MELNRYENVQFVLKIVDLKIRNNLKNKNSDIDDLLSLVEIRTTYMEEFDNLNKSMKIKETFKKENGYER